MCLCGGVGGGGGGGGGGGVERLCMLNDICRLVEI